MNFSLNMKIFTIYFMNIFSLEHRIFTNGNSNTEIMRNTILLKLHPM